jgi:hypothetical protein
MSPRFTLISAIKSRNESQPCSPDTDATRYIVSGPPRLSLGESPPSTLRKPIAISLIVSPVRSTAFDTA